MKQSKCEWLVLPSRGFEMLLSWKMIWLSSGFFRFKFDTRKASFSPCMYATSTVLQRVKSYWNHWLKWLNNMILVVVSNIFYFHPYLGKWSNLTNIFQMGWNHQLGNHWLKWFNNMIFGCHKPALCTPPGQEARGTTVIPLDSRLTQHQASSDF